MTWLPPPDGPYFPAPSSSAEELIAAVGLEPLNLDSARPILDRILVLSDTHLSN